MKKNVWILLALVLMLTGCGAASTTQEMQFTKSEASLDYSGWNETPMDAADETGQQLDIETESSADALQNSKFIYTANIVLETKEFDQAVASIDRLVSSLGGYYEGRSIDQGGSYRSLNGTVRVPVGQYDAFLGQLGTAAHLLSCNEEKQNISESYYDVEVRLTTQKTKMERLQKLLQQAASMEDIISLESAISETELQIEYLTGSLRKYDNLVEYATITVYLDEVYRLSTDEAMPETFGERFSSAFVRGFERGVSDVEDVIIGLARNWLSILINAAWIAAVVILVVRWNRRRGRPGLPRWSRKRKNDEQQ